MPNIQNSDCTWMQLNFVSIPEALIKTTAETLIMKEVHGVTPQIPRPAGSTAVFLVVEINLDLVCFEGVITKPYHIKSRLWCPFFVMLLHMSLELVKEPCIT